MTNSATSTKARREPDGSTGFQAWHFFTLLAMIAATAVVIMSRDTHPAALLLMSAAVLGAGFLGLAVSRAVAGFFNRGEEPAPLPKQVRVELQREKSLVLRSLKELEFDKAMGKVGDEDFSAISSRLRARALVLMKELDRPDADDVARIDAPVVATPNACPACGTVNDVDARFCKACGEKVGAAQ